MALLIGNAQHVGGRSNQQDAFGFSNPADSAFRQHGGMLAVLADGMGGLAHGAEASRLAVRIFLAAYETKTPQEPIPDALLRSLMAASEHLKDLAGTLGDLGSTLVAAVVRESELYWISVGDSSLLLIRGGSVTHVNTPHTFAVHLCHAAAEGRISLEEASSHPERESLTSNLGTSVPGEIDHSLRPFHLRPEDRVILCSDGLSKVVPPEQIVALAAGHPQEASERMVQTALQLGGEGQDNVTVLGLWNEKARTARPVLLPTSAFPVVAPARRSRRLTPALLIAFLVLGIGAAAVLYWRETEPPPLPIPAPKPPPAVLPPQELQRDPTLPVEEQKPRKQKKAARPKDR